MIYKWAFHNKGRLVITDGNRYVGFFIEKHPSELNGINTGNTLDIYLSYSKQEIKELGIDKITDWKEWETE